MPRYELSEGTSNKFWQIDLKGASFTTTFGKIGSSGQTSLKEFGDAATAKKEHDKLVAEKTKKGYVIVGVAKKAAPAAEKPKAKAAAAPVARATTNPTLEKAIDAEPDGDDSWSVYADWLEAQGDPRGQLAAVQLTLAKNPRDKAALAAEKKLIKDHADVLIGAGVAKYMVRSGKNEIAGVTRKPDLGCDFRTDDHEAAPIRVDWKAGFFKHAFVAHPGMDWSSGYGKKAKRGEDDDGDDDGGDEDGDSGMVEVDKLLTSLLDSPSARFLTSLTLGLPNSAEDGDCEYDPVLKALVKHPNAARLRALSIGDIVYEDSMISSIEGDISKIIPKLPNLRALTVRGNGIKLGKLDLAELHELTIVCGGLRKADVTDILGGKFPKLEKLEISFGQKNYGADVKLKDLEPLLAGKVFKTVKHLGLCNCEFADELAAALGTSKILAQVTSLDLSDGTLTEAGVKAMAEHADAFAHLRKLDLSKNYLNGAAEKLATKILAHARTKPQRTAREYGGESHRYAVLGE